MRQLSLAIFALQINGRCFPQLQIPSCQISRFGLFSPLFWRVALDEAFSLGFFVANLFLCSSCNFLVATAKNQGCEIWVNFLRVYDGN